MIEDMRRYILISYIFNCIFCLHFHISIITRITDGIFHGIFSFHPSAFSSLFAERLSFFLRAIFNKVTRRMPWFEWDNRARRSVIQCLPLWLPTLCVSDTLRGLNFRTWYALPIDPIKPDLNFNGCHRKPRSFRCA